jgi:tetratricopeptide (TPR) repeat protein
VKASRITIALILLIPIGLVAGPVLSAGLRSEIAHWYLAAAANAIELGKGDPEKAIESARSWDPNLGKLQDYWTVRLRQLKTKSAGTSLNELTELLKEVPDERKTEMGATLARDLGNRGEFELAAEVLHSLLGEEALKNIFYWDAKISAALNSQGAASAIIALREAVETNPNNTQLREVLAEQYALILAAKNEFDSALEAYKILFGEKYARDVVTLNTLAYSRALAHVELDEALVDIDKALSFQPKEPGMRDTRAWVLYHMGRYEEALVDADFAVKEMERPTLMNWLQSQLESPAIAPPASAASREDGKSPEGDAALHQESNQQPKAAEVSESKQVQMNEPTLEGIAEPLPDSEPHQPYLTPRLAKPTIWTLGVLRYHRAKILEKLGRSAEARADWDWLEKEHLPPDDRLH